MDGAVVAASLDRATTLSRYRAFTSHQSSRGVGEKVITLVLSFHPCLFRANLSAVLNDIAMRYSRELDWLFGKTVSFRIAWRNGSVPAHIRFRNL